MNPDNGQFEPVTDETPEWWPLFTVGEVLEIGGYRFEVRQITRKEPPVAGNWAGEWLIFWRLSQDCPIDYPPRGTVVWLKEYRFVVDHVFDQGVYLKPHPDRDVRLADSASAIGKLLAEGKLDSASIGAEVDLSEPLRGETRAEARAREALETIAPGLNLLPHEDEEATEPRATYEGEEIAALKKELVIARAQRDLVADAAAKLLARLAELRGKGLPAKDEMERHLQVVLKYLPDVRPFEVHDGPFPLVVPDARYHPLEVVAGKLFHRWSSTPPGSPHRVIKDEDATELRDGLRAARVARVKEKA